MIQLNTAVTHYSTKKIANLKKTKKLKTIINRKNKNQRNNNYNFKKLQIFAFCFGKRY